MLRIEAVMGMEEQSVVRELAWLGIAIGIETRTLHLVWALGLTSEMHIQNKNGQKKRR